MKHVKFGKSDLKVTRIGLGAWQLGSKGWGLPEKERSKQVINHSLDQGLNFIDTAEIYNDGLSESILGETLKERGARDDVVIASKVSGQHLRYRDVLKAADESLKRLQTDVIDLYQIHWPNTYVPLKETMKALDELLHQGKIRYVGLSNFPVCRSEEALGLLKHGEVVSSQLRYNALQRDIEKEIRALLTQHSIVILAYSPLAQGMLTGKYDETSTFPPEDVRSRNPLFRNRENLAKVKDLITVMRDIAAKHNANVAQVALNWLLKFEDVFPIPGAKSPEQVESNINATKWHLTDEEWKQITAARDNIALTTF